MEGKGNVSAISLYSNQREAEVTVGTPLTVFIVDHIEQGKMEEKGNMSAIPLYSNQK